MPNSVVDSANERGSQVVVLVLKDRVDCRDWSVHILESTSAPPQHLHSLQTGRTIASIEEISCHSVMSSEMLLSTKSRLYPCDLHHQQQYHVPSLVTLDKI